MDAMNELNGWVKLNRSMLDWEWYDDTNTKVVFLHLLLTANWEEKRYHGHVIKEGDTIIGLKALAKRLDMSIQQVRTALNHLKSTGEITIKSTNQFSIVTIENWAKYQVDETPINTPNNKPTTNEQQTDNKRATTPKEIKNIRNKEDIYTCISKWNEICVDYPKVIKADSGSTRYKTIKARLDEYGLDKITEVFTKVQASSFLKGEGNRGWQASFDWVMKPSNFMKVLEGNYDGTIKGHTAHDQGRDWDSIMFG